MEERRKDYGLLTQKVDIIYNALLGKLGDEKEGLQHKINILFEERKALKNWLLGSIIGFISTLIGVSFTAGVITTNLKILQETVLNNTKRIEHIENRLFDRVEIPTNIKNTGQVINKVSM